MDVDRVDEPGPSTSNPNVAQKRLTVPVDDAHPFDLESYISNYSGRTAIDRLAHIVSIAPSIAPEAYTLAIQFIQQSRDPGMYQALSHAYENTASSSTGDTRPPEISTLPQLDSSWTEETFAKNQTEKNKLEVELKTYTNNMIKESIRMAHRDLGDFHRSTGDYGMSLKHYTKSREFCTTSQHVLEMCMSILELLIEQRNYSHLTTYVFKADAALDATAAAASAANPSGAPPVGSSGAPTPSVTALSGKKKNVERDNVQAKLDLATALSHLGQASYEKAAQSFLKVTSTKDLGDWAGKLVAPGDIAIYGTLCALATFQRSQIKSRIIENSHFGAFIEQESYIRELIEAYMNSNFKTVLEILSRYSTRHVIDIHLSPHVHDLTTLITNRAVVLYFQPFQTIKLERMAGAFGWSIDQVEGQVVGLIQAGEVQARVDSQNKILQAKQTDYRAELFARTIKAGQDIQSTNRKLLLRMRLQQADLVIRPPKQQAHGGGTLMEFYQE